eukprot:6903520-Prymnesium_polylepis.2
MSLACRSHTQPSHTGDGAAADGSSICSGCAARRETRSDQCMRSCRSRPLASLSVTLQVAEVATAGWIAICCDHAFGRSATLARYGRPA